MLLISWNVAGLSTTLSKIDHDYKSASIAASASTEGKAETTKGNETKLATTNTTATKNTSRNKTSSARSRSHAFSYYLKRHGNPEILCIQEHKIPIEKLSAHTEPFGIANELEGYESYWSCCTDKTKRGFNGVVTFVQKNSMGSTKVKANSRPLGSKELDDQGRVLLTDHGKFVVFNVYAPASCGMPLSYKMKFLNALRRAMTEQRQQGKKVILTGDLNIAHHGIDEFYLFRSIQIDDILQEAKEEREDLPKWKADVAKYWDIIQSTLNDTLEAIPVTTTNSATGSTYEKYRARVTMSVNNNEPGERKILLGSNETTAQDCIASYTFPQSEYHDEDLKKTVISRKPNTVRLGILAELMSKIAKLHDWSNNTKIRDIAKSLEGPKKTSPTCKWLTELLEQDEMVDVFRHLYPKAKDRFTVWTQMTNRRYENDGARIDYTIVDNSLLQNCIDTPTKPKLRCAKYDKTCKKSDEDKADNINYYDSEEAALHAATASGLFQAVPLTGGGIMQASHEALETQFGDDGEKHTGIIYTAPQYSDHVAVSLFLNEKFDQDYLKVGDISSSCNNNSLEKETKRAQPHKAQMKISSFFNNNNNNNNSSSLSSSKRKISKSNSMTQKQSAMKKKKKKNPSKGTIMSHFAKKK